MVLRVTFDTNVLDLACRPERFPKDPRQPHLQKVKDALTTGAIQGFFQQTMLTIEGIMCNDRAYVFAGTRTRIEPEVATITKSTDLPNYLQAMVREEDVETRAINVTVEQPGRQPLHREVTARVEAALELGVRILKGVPRIGNAHNKDSKNNYYLNNGEEDALDLWINKINNCSRAIESRGRGIAQVKALGKNFADPAETWFHALENAMGIHQKKKVIRAFSEWADGDAIASHIAYGLDVYCTNDVGNSNAARSVLDTCNRAWLTSTYDIKFMTFDELMEYLP